MSHLARFVYGYAVGRTLHHAAALARARGDHTVPAHLAALFAWQIIAAHTARPAVEPIIR